MRYSIVQRDRLKSVILLCYSDLFMETVVLLSSYLSDFNHIVLRYFNEIYAQHIPVATHQQTR